MAVSPMQMDDVLSSLLINSLRRNSTFLAAHWILRGARAQSTDTVTGQTALQMAIIHQLRSVTQMLLETTGDCCVDVRDQNSDGLLHLIARHGAKFDWSNVGRMLIQLGVSTDSVNDQGQTALHVAVSSQNLRFARFLIRSGASMKAADSNGSTPLHLSVHQVEMMRLLLESGADYESRDCYLQTPLHVAAIKGQYSVAKMLVFYRARVHVVDLFDKTPLDYAVKLHPHEEIRQMLDYYSRKDDRKEQVNSSPPPNCPSFVTVYDLTV
jgi:ankyrin repeat protein